MTASARPIPSQPTPPPSCYSKTISKACGTLCNAGCGALAGYVFTIINPVGGAVFGASLALTSWAFDSALDCMGWKREDSASATARWAVSFFAAIAASAAITSAIGFPITFTVAVILSAAMVITSCLTSTLFGSCILGTCLVGVVATRVAGNQENSQGSPRYRQPVRA